MQPTAFLSPAPSARRARHRARIVGAIVAAALAIGAGPVRAQTYPNKPIRFLVPFAPVGSVISLRGSSRTR